jgi:hypothetical protein
MLSNELTRIWVTWRDSEPADIRAYAQGVHDYVELKRFTSDEQLFRWLSLHELCLAFTSELDEDPIKRVAVALRTRIVPLATRCA